MPQRPFLARVSIACSLVLVAQWAEASPLAYITNSSDGTVSVIDTDTGAVVTTVTNTSLFPAHVALNAAGTRAYITSLNASPPSIRVLDTQTNDYITSVNVPVLAGTFFTNLIVSPTQPFAYLGIITGEVYPLDLATNVLGTPFNVPLSGGDEVRSIALDPTGATLYATKEPSGEISVIDVASEMEIDTIPGGGLRELLVDPAGDFVYAVHESSFGAANDIVKSSTATNTAVDSETYGVTCTGLRSLAIDAAGTTLYASCLGTGSVAVIDTATLAATFVSVGFLPSGISLTPDDTKLYVANQGDDTVSVIDTGTDTVVATIPVGGSPLALGSFIGPDFVCGNGTLEPGEGCDDGNLADGDGCTSTCYVVQDFVVAPVKPVKITIAPAAPSVVKKLQAKVRNADSVQRSVLVVANSTACNAAFATANFGAGVHVPVTVAAGKTAKGTVEITALAGAAFQPNFKAPIRCTFTLTAYPNPMQFTLDANPSNDVAAFDVDILDQNQTELATAHETTITAMKPIRMKIKAGGTSAAKKAKFKAGNADYLPAPEPAMDHTVSITALDGDCPLSTAGVATLGGGASADIAGGSTATGEVTFTATASGLASAGKHSPARCVATVAAVGPGGDSVPENNTATVTIDVVDFNDF